MRAEFEHWGAAFPKAVAEGDAAFSGSPVATFVRSEIPAAIRAAIGASADRWQIEASAGRGGWTHTPWAAVLDPAATTSVQEGIYVVYLLSADGRRLYLTLNQGCTRLRAAVGHKAARDELIARAEMMRAKLGSRPKRLRRVGVDLGSNLWRAELYQAGEVVGVAYDTAHLPSEASLIADLQEALSLYAAIQQEGGWASQDEVMQEAEADGLNLTLTQAKLYRRHRSIERQKGHSDAVKRLQGTTCKGCDKNMGDVYGTVGKGLIHAHHLRPLAALAEGETVTYDARRDFAVLCPNCHAIIHRMDDVGDVAGLRRLLSRRV